MAIPTLSVGQAIDYDFINTLVKKINQLEDADNVQALASRNSTYYSSDDKILVQAFRKTINTKATTKYYDGADNTITYPKRFTDTPIVTVTFDGMIWLTPCIHSIGAATFKLGAFRNSPSNDPSPNLMPATIYANIIAVGPFAG